MYFPKKAFYGVFELPLLRNAQKRWEKTKGKKFFFSQLFRPKVFDMYFPQKVFNGVFELPLSLVEKRTKTPLKKKEVPTYPIYHLPGIRRFQFYCSSAPLAPTPEKREGAGPKNIGDPRGGWVVPRYGI
jgi:hypothetical protein